MTSLFSNEQMESLANEIAKQVGIATAPLNVEIISLKQQLTAAQAANGNATGSTPLPSTQSRKKEKVKEPDTYKGGRDKTKSFLTQVQLVFDAQAHIYDNDMKKIRYAASFCRDGAWDWFQGHLEAKTFEKPGVTYQTFCDRLLKDYGEVDTHHESLRKLRKLMQKGPCSKYTTDFNILANRTQLNDAAKMDEFRHGLKDSVKDMLVNMTRPKTLEELQEQAVDADYRIFERQSEKRNDSMLRSNHISVTQNNTAGPQPMQVDSVSVRHRGPITAEEKQRRRDNKLCLYDGRTDCGGFPDVSQCKNAPIKKSPLKGQGQN